MWGNILSSAQRFLEKIPVIGTIGKALQPTAQKVGSTVSSFFNPPSVTAQNPPSVPKPVIAPPRQLPPQPPSTQTTLPQSSYYRLPSTPTYTPPTPSQFGVPSMEEAANKASQERMSKYAETVAPYEQALSSYLASRRPYGEVYSEQLASQGVPERQKALAGFEKDILNQQGLLETLPKEDIQRRQETGMLTEAARRRIQAMEERPIREQLFKTNEARQTEEVGYNRA